MTMGRSALLADRAGRSPSDQQTGDSDARNYDGE
jgi:hypothetical protein